MEGLAVDAVAEFAGEGGGPGEPVFDSAAVAVRCPGLREVGVPWCGAVGGLRFPVFTVSGGS